jgi:hypothetical protein
MCGNFIWARGNYRKQSHHGEDRQVGTGAHGARQNLHPPNGDQIPDSSGFRGRMD